MPRSDTPKDFAVGIAASIAATGLISLAIVGLGDADVRFAAIAALFVVAVTALALVVTMSPRWVGGRERFMERNCKAMNREVARVDRGEAGLIETTRFARWHLDERSTAPRQAAATVWTPPLDPAFGSAGFTISSPRTTGRSSCTKSLAMRVAKRQVYASYSTSIHT